MLKKLFSNKKNRGAKKNSLFQKRKKTQATYKKRKNFSFRLDANFFRKIRYFYYAVGFIALTSFIYFFGFSNYFLVTTLKVEKQDNNSSIEIAYWVLDPYIGKNIFILDVSELKKELFESQENLGKITITKQFPKTLRVNLSSYKELYNTIIKDKWYLMLANGSVVPWTSEELLQIYLKYDTFPLFYEYKSIVPARELASIYALEQQMKANFLGSKLQKVNYYVAAKEVHFILETGATLIFDVIGDPAYQIEKLAVFHAENMEITSSTLIYVDLRIQNKLYFCDAETEFDCYNNLNFLYGTER